MILQSYIVDLGMTMFSAELNNAANKMDRQVLKCLCGHETVFNKHVSRSIIAFSSGVIDDGSGLTSIMCEKCHAIYPDVEKPRILKPNSFKLIEIVFSTSEEKDSDGNTIHKITRQRNYIGYNNNFVFESVYDTIQYNELTNECYLFIDNQKHIDENYHLSAVVWNSNKEPVNISHKLDLTNLTSINKFFGYTNGVFYEGLQEAFLFFKKIDFKIRDFEKIKQLPIIDVIYDSYVIDTKEEFIHGFDKKRKIQYRLVDLGFGDNVKEMVLLEPGSYLESIVELARLFFATIIFPNITTILFTKGYQFLDEFLKDKVVCSAAVYLSNSATSPSKIVETSINFYNEESGKEYLKVSNILFKSLRKPEDISALMKFFKTKILTKQEIEQLFVWFSADDVYECLEIFSQNNTIGAKINLRHIRHVIRHKLYVDYFNKRFFEEYTDTINTIWQIIESKEKAYDFYIKNKKKLSKDEKASYKKYFEVNSNIIFKAKTPRKLKSLHDEISSLHSIFLDAEKTIAYKASIHGLDKFFNQELNGVKFSVIPTAHEMHIEHIVMSHCAQIYVDNVIAGKYLIIRIQDTISKERATLGLIRKNRDFSFNQLKGYGNSRATKFLIDTVLEYCKKNEIKIENSNYNFVDLQPDKNSEKKMPDYLSDDEIIRIRKIKLENRINSQNSPLNKEMINSIFEKFKEETSQN